MRSGGCLSTSNSSSHASSGFSTGTLDSPSLKPLATLLTFVDAFVRPYTLDKKLEPGDVVETRLRLDLVKKADRYWWLWYAVVHMQPSSWLSSVGGVGGVDTLFLSAVRRDGDKEASTVPFPESYFRIDPRKIITSLPIPASSAKPPSVPALDSPPASTSQE